MGYDPEKHHRRSIRLKGYDYAQEGAYFITLRVQGGLCLFGQVRGGQMQLNDAGMMVAKWWEILAEHFPSVEIDEFVVMPNHFHGIVLLVAPDETVGADRRVCPGGDAPQPPGAYQGEHTDSGAHADSSEHTEGAHTGSGEPTEGEPTGAPIRVPLSTIVQWFKTMSTNEYIRGVKQYRWPPFPGKLWQRNYYEHIIRNDDDLNNTREYILNNPTKWEMDRDNPFFVPR